jgi:hypothetical protein
VRSKALVALLALCLTAALPATAGATTEKQQNRTIKKLERRVKSLRVRLTRLEATNASLTAAFGGLVSCFATVKVSRYGDTLGTSTDGYDYTDTTAQQFKTSALDVDNSGTGGVDFVLTSPACADIFNQPTAAALGRLAVARAFAPFDVTFGRTPKLAP